MLAKDATKKNPIKKEYMVYALTALMLVLTVISFFTGKYSSVGVNRGEVNTDYTEGNTLVTQELLTETVKENINTYFEEANIQDYISEEDMEQLVAEITAGVLNSIPEDMLSDDEMDAVRVIINAAIQDVVDEQNKSIENAVDDNKSIITEELKKYITNNIVPTLTATIQINSGEIDDLKDSLATLSSQYASNKAYYDKIIDSLKAEIENMGDGADSEQINALKTQLNELSTVLDAYKSNNSAQVTDIENELNAVRSALEKEIEELEIRLSDLTNAQLTEIKKALQDQIDANIALTESQKAELSASISSLTSTTKTLEEATAELEADIAAKTQENTDALNSFISSLYGNASGEVTISDLLTQISANTELTNEQKDALVEMINIKYAQVSADATAQVADVKEDLLEEVENRNHAIEEAVESLKTSLETKVAELEIKVQNLVNSQIETLRNSLLAQIETNKNLSDEQKILLQEQLNDLADNAASAEELGMAVTEMTELINRSAAENQQALTDALNNLLGDDATAGITISELEDRIAAADISPEQKQSLLDAIAASYADATVDTTIKVEDAKTALQTEIDNKTAALTNAVNSLQVELETKLAELEIKVTGLIDTNIQSLRNSLLAQIEANKELSDEQKARLETEINTLANNSATSEELSEAVSELMAEINQSAIDNQTALNNAINNLLGDDATAGITISELEDRIAAADISPEQKQSLLDAIAASYADATADTTIKVEDAKTALQTEIDNKTAALTATVNSVQTQLESQISSLSSQMNANKAEQNEINESLQEQIDLLNSAKDGICEIRYENGEFVVYNPDGTVAKKLVSAE